MTTAYMQASEARDHPALSATAIEGLVVGLFVGSLEAIETEFEWMAAVEWEVEWTGCDVTSPDPLNSTVTCTANHSTAWGRALGVGPFTGERYFRVHHDGQEILGRFIEAPTVTQSATQLRDRAFVDEVWEPFVDWLASTRPEQVDSVLSTRVGEDGVDVFFTAIAFRR